MEWAQKPGTGALAVQGVFSLLHHNPGFLDLGTTESSSQRVLHFRLRLGSTQPPLSIRGFESLGRVGGRDC